MIEESDILSLQARFDDRYKLQDDCNREMFIVTDSLHKHDIDVALITQQLKIIKWIATTTLGAVIATAVGIFIRGI